MSQQSRITEGMKKSIGTVLGKQTVEVDEKWILRFAAVMQDKNPLWTNPKKASKGRYKGIIAPPSFIYGFHTLATPRGVFRLPPDLPSQPVDAGGVWEFFEPVRPGDTITLTGKIVDVYERPGRSGLLLFMINEIEYRNQKDQLVAKYRLTHICR